MPLLRRCQVLSSSSSVVVEVGSFVAPSEPLTGRATTVSCGGLPDTAPVGSAGVGTGETTVDASVRMKLLIRARAE